MKRLILDKGKCNYHIVTGTMPHEAELYAASQLSWYLYNASKAFVPVFSSLERCPKRSPELCIGNNIRGISVDTDCLSDDGFRIKTVGEDIVIAGKTPRGTLYGVYYFLEKYINFRCFTKDIETFDNIEKLEVEDLDIIENPAFEYREVYFRSAFDADFCIKNGLNSNMAHIPKERGGKMKFFNFHHSFCDLVPPEKYFDEHPEYFSLVNGERQREHTQLCLTNEDVYQIALGTLRRWIKENHDCKVFSVAQNDCFFYCTCPKCKELDDRYSSPAGSLITFINRLADDIKEDYPDVLIHTFAYQYSKKAPVGLTVADNVIVRLCNIECSWEKSMEKKAEEKPDSESAGFIKNISDWGKICKHLYIWDYACNFGNYLLPFPNYKSMPENLRTYRKNNLVGVMQQGNFSYGEASGMADLESYLAARLLWNPDRDEDKIIDEFILGVYGKKAHPYIREYIDLLLKSIEKNDLYIFHNTDSPIYSDELVEKAEKLFQSAIETADTEKQKWYLEKEYLSVMFMKASRMPLEDPEREKLIDELYYQIKEFGITEIRERKNIETSFENLRKHRYFASEIASEYHLYYIMK